MQASLSISVVIILDDDETFIRPEAYSHSASVVRVSRLVVTLDRENPRVAGYGYALRKDGQRNAISNPDHLAQLTSDEQLTWFEKACDIYLDERVDPVRSA
jgi:hypothetical protein